MRNTSCLAGFIALALCGTAGAQPPTYEEIEPLILDRAPPTRVDAVDHERLVVRRIDVVDDEGVIRAVLAGTTPEPILDGIQYRRRFDAAGLVVYDQNGSERGGLGVGTLPDGSTVTVSALDHPNNDAVGWGVAPDGSVGIFINQRGELVREPRLDDRLMVNPGPNRVSINVAADGAPSINLSDEAGRPRLRLAVTAEGHGAIEFLDAEGEVIHTLAPGAGS